MRTITASLDNIPEALREYIGKRSAELCALAFAAAGVCLALALATWSSKDPSLNYATDGPVRNLLGAPGALIADLLMQLIGLSAILVLAPLFSWAWLLANHHRVDRVARRVALMFFGVICASAMASLFPVTARWPLPSGLGGIVGDALLSIPRRVVGDDTLGSAIGGLLFAMAALVSLAASSASNETVEVEALDDEEPVRMRETREDRDRAGEPGLALVLLGAFAHMFLMLRARLTPRPGQPITERAPASSRVEPVLSGRLETPRATTPVLQPAAEPNLDELPPEPAPPPVRRAGRIAVAPVADKPQQRPAARQPVAHAASGAFELPALELLSEAKKGQGGKLSPDALEQNARVLESVLEDFGVRGQIISVRPGPVVTLYELEPAPGIKSARVIGLADDIARSMSAISARVAVVQGRNAIGVELPNQRRETVYLRELVGSEDFENTKHKLAIALGKTIGGEAVIVDLARMPHLLVAGTTGSGKSVAINTFVLSLLYRLSPQECRLIMIDPKMLELSVYDGIPHLLTPVVTEPKKAIVALKWAVKEMEDRYKKMSKLGVRNIDGFNARVAEARAKGEVISRTVQTGFDRETGEAIYESEEMDLSVLPYIVVIVDEMADLMMVAGKDIEGAIQRLAQMARAAGIHLIMATQRPSVDVITGTIKANFPTRISFQVTSKIDSRTILGEQGAEQLLGQGDMLYMAGGGRISRVHGPFVSDLEVEKIVAHLKSQGQPEYLDAIVDDSDGDGEDGAPFDGGVSSGGGSELYDQALAIVLRDRKCSTSYIQRRLSVGYNKAASLVERMEKEGVVGPANHAGKREILVGEGIDRGAFNP